MTAWRIAVVAVAAGAAFAGCGPSPTTASSPKAASIANQDPAPPAPSADSAPAPGQLPVDPDRMDRADVVLRVRRLDVGGGSKYIWERVEVLEVLKNTTTDSFDKPFEVARYSWKAGLPTGISTIYLEPYGGHTQNLWRLLDADGAVGVSHSEPGAAL